MSHLKMEFVENKNVFGTMLSEMYVPNIVRIFKRSGFDFVIVDCEHGSFDYTNVANIAAVAKGVNLTCIVRIPKIERECILKYLEAGVDGLLVPMVSSAEEIKQVVDYAKYAPLGNRGISTLRAHTDYNSSNMTEYIERANRDTFIIPQIETVAGLEAVGEIVRVEGVDGVVVGPNDLSMELGILGDYQHPLMQDAMKKVASVAKEAGSWSGIISSNKKLLLQCQDLGMQFFSWNSEIGMIMESAKGTLGYLRG